MTDQDLRRLALGVLMPGFSGTTVPQWLRPYLREGLAAVCLFAMNTPDLPTTRHLTDELRSYQPSLLITTDEEGGDVTRLQRVHGSWLAGNEALGVVDDLELTRRVGTSLGQLVRSAGIDLTLAPCLDVASNPDNPVIGTRSLGAATSLVTEHGLALLDGIRSGGSGSCVKHFPGHGDTATDSHHAVPVVSASAEVIEERDVAPFVAAIDHQLTDAVMTGHIVCPAFGEEPASLSPWAYQRIRSAGFSGPILTDALGMKAVSQGDDRHPAGIGEAVVRALVAGADLCCLDSPHGRDEEATLTAAVDAVVAALQAGRLLPERLAASAGRVGECVTAVRTRAGATETNLEQEQVERATELVGLETARRAVQGTGPVTLSAEPGGFCDLRAGSQLASGSMGSVTFDAVNRARRKHGRPELVALNPDEALTEPGQLVLLTRVPLADAEEGARLATLLAARPDAVVIHAGMAQAAPAASRLVCSHGLGLAASVAVAELLTGDSPAVRSS